MKLNKQGFTLVEILVVIVLISLILGLGIPGIMKLSENMKKRSLNSKINIVESAAIVWGNDNKTLLKKTICEINGLGYDCYKLSLGNLIEEDYLPSESVDKISYLNPSNKEELINNCIYIYKRNNKVYSYLAIDDKTCVYKSNDDINEEPDVPESNEEEEEGTIRIPDDEQSNLELKSSLTYEYYHSYSDTIVYCENECVEEGNVCSKEEIQNGIYCQVIVNDPTYEISGNKITNNKLTEREVMDFHVLKNTDNVLYLLSDDELYDKSKGQYVTLNNISNAYKTINEVTTKWKKINQYNTYREALGYHKDKTFESPSALTPNYNEEYYYNAILPDYSDLEAITLDSSLDGNSKLPYWTIYTYYDDEKIWLNGYTGADGSYHIKDYEADECYSNGGYYEFEFGGNEGYSCVTSSWTMNHYGCMTYNGNPVLDSNCLYFEANYLDNVTTRVILPIKKENVTAETYVIDVDKYYSYIDYMIRGASEGISPINSFTTDIDDEIWGKTSKEIKYFLYNDNLYISNIEIDKYLYDGNDSSKFYIQSNGMQCKFYYNDKELEFEPIWDVDSIYTDTEVLYKTTANNIPISNNTIQNGNIEYKCYNYELLPHSDGGYYIEKEMIKSGTLF